MEMAQCRARSQVVFAWQAINANAIKKYKIYVSER